jgi:hypothetical protein
MTDFKFNVGDRVAEKPIIRINVSATPEASKRFAAHTGQRFGVVTGLLVKKNKRQSRKFIEVLWDGHQASSQHEQMRICLASDLDDLKKELFAGHA